MKTKTILTASLALALALAGQTAATAQTAPNGVAAAGTGVLKTPTPIALVINGKQVGKTTLPPGTKVSILRDDPSTGKTLIKAKAGETWVASGDVEATAAPETPAPTPIQAPVPTPAPTPEPASEPTPEASANPAPEPSAAQQTGKPRILYVISSKKNFLTQDLQKINGLRAAGYPVTVISAEAVKAATEHQKEMEERTKGAQIQNRKLTPEILPLPASATETPLGWPALDYTERKDHDRLGLVASEPLETGTLDGDCVDGTGANMDNFDILFLGTFNGPIQGGMWLGALNAQAIQQKKLIIAKAAPNMDVKGLTDRKVLEDSRLGRVHKPGVKVKSPTVIFYQDTYNFPEDPKNAQVLKSLLKELQRLSLQPQLR